MEEQVSTINGRASIPYLRSGALIASTWTEALELVSRVAVRLDDIVGYWTTGEDRDRPWLHLAMRGGHEIVLQVGSEGTDDADFDSGDWQGWADFTETLDAELAGIAKREGRNS